MLPAFPLLLRRTIRFVLLLTLVGGASGCLVFRIERRTEVESTPLTSEWGELEVVDRRLDVRRQMVQLTVRRVGVESTREVETSEDLLRCQVDSHLGRWYDAMHRVDEWIYLPGAIVRDSVGLVLSSIFRWPIAAVRSIDPRSTTRIVERTMAEVPARGTTFRCERRLPETSKIILRTIESVTADGATLRVPIGGVVRESLEAGQWSLEVYLQDPELEEIAVVPISLEEQIELVDAQLSRRSLDHQLEVWEQLLATCPPEAALVRAALGAQRDRVRDLRR